MNSSRQRLLLMTGFALIILGSCSNYKDQPLGNTYTQELNDSLSRAQDQRQRWVDSPDEIAKHFFPQQTKDYSSSAYKFKSESTSSLNKQITITDEGKGGSEDEISGTRHIINFERIDNRWRVTKVRMQLKRRN